MGNRVREQRIRAGMTKQTLVEKCQCEFPQVQKYEKGTNRMGASRLIQIAGILGVSVSTVFKDICAKGAAEAPLDRDTAKVARDWRGIAGDRTRDVMRDVTRALSKAG